MAESYKSIAQFQDATVALAYEPVEKNATRYESEAQMESRLIAQLRAQGYGNPDIHSEAELIANLRTQLQRLNGYTFTDSEWKRLLEGELAKPNSDIVEKTRLIQDGDTAIALLLDDGTYKNIRLLDKRDIHRNYLQVINQYVPEGGSHDNRYDVTVLVNGLPLVHIELKRRGVDIKEAFNQINRYGRESFWAGCGLFEYVQIFVISNGTYTKYYSNTTRERRVKEAERGQKKGSRFNTSNSFEFTSYWADRSNRIIPDIEDFTATFFAPNTILNVLIHYCVFTVENTLLVMRPYQISATEAIIQRIGKATNYKEWGTTRGGGYVWHTTGSGKTLTSFKTARLATELDGIDKVMFVVDRKDLDYQTMKEYNRFEKDAVNGNKSTEALKRQLEDPKAKIIVTTIQKLAVFIKKYPGHAIYQSHCVIIFDECHRSQFGEMHRAISKNFKRYHMFGFTGTPIFPENATGGHGAVMTTEQLFGDRLHIYTILNAIEDGNVLPFKVDFVRTAKIRNSVDDEMVQAIDGGNIILAHDRIANITSYILEHFAQKTRQDKAYEFRRLMNIEAVSGRRHAQEDRRSMRVTGFNSIFAVQSIQAAKAYYEEFRNQQKDIPEAQRLKVGLIYSYGVNEAEMDGSMLDENSESTSMLDASSRDFLEAAIMDYNVMFGTSYDTSDREFESYYKDVSLRMKNKELDILIVVNMFLTGFDATTLNTLWVDKNLRSHGLIQAYSRTNRILNSVKTYGNIVCFRDLSKETDDAIALFGDKESKGLVLLRTFEEYLRGYTDSRGRYHVGYIQNVERLREQFPDFGREIQGEAQEKKFVELYNEILKQRNILTSFDEFEAVDPMTEREMQDYASTYQNLHDKYRGHKEKEAVDVNDDIVFEMELVKQIEINIDYILFLIEKYQESGYSNMEVVADIRRAVNASPSLRNKRDLIEDFIARLDPETDDVVGDWLEYVNGKRQEELDAIIREENLNPERTEAFVEQCFREGEVKETGTEVSGILPPMSMFSKDRTTKKSRVIARLKAFFQKYGDIGGFFAPKNERICPVCGAKMVPIVYGEPSAELFAKAERKEVILGGCCITGNDPQWGCPECYEQ